MGEAVEKRMRELLADTPIGIEVDVISHQATSVKTAVIFLTLPLILTGVVAGLLAFDKPFGFMALLGFLSLVGMQVKNAIVLMDEISANLDRGLAPYAAVVDAGVSRLRPVFNASLTMRSIRRWPSPSWSGSRSRPSSQWW